MIEAVFLTIVAAVYCCWLQGLPGQNGSDGAMGETGMKVRQHNTLSVAQSCTFSSSSRETEVHAVERDVLDRRAKRKASSLILWQVNY